MASIYHSQVINYIIIMVSYNGYKNHIAIIVKKFDGQTQTGGYLNHLDDHIIIPLTNKEELLTSEIVEADTKSNWLIGKNL